MGSSRLVEGRGDAVAQAVRCRRRESCAPAVCGYRLRYWRRCLCYRCRLLLELCVYVNYAELSIIIDSFRFSTSSAFPRSPRHIAILLDLIAHIHRATSAKHHRPPSAVGVARFAACPVEH